MKNTFREYHQFSDGEFKELWKDCLFVFDTNTLLNMYRYSRKTVDAYFQVLDSLKIQNQLWIPYQVGYEFYENRIDVISEYDGSYDSVLSILDKAKKDIEERYKNHPFLDLSDIKNKIESGLVDVENEIKKAKGNHPKWMDKDDILEKLNNIFENSVGTNYDEKRLTEIKEEGKERYEKKIPPGFTDDKKLKNKYGDLIIWYQIIDKAKETNKPIIFISGDVKEDWILEKNGKKIMPLPQLKKEMSEKAGVDFHIYSADKFLAYYDTKVPAIIIGEVRKIREFEEEKERLNEIKSFGENKEFVISFAGRHTMYYVYIFEILESLMKQINDLAINEELRLVLNEIYLKLKEFVKTVETGRFYESYLDFYKYVKEISRLINDQLDLYNNYPELLPAFSRFTESIARLENMMRNLRRA